MLLGYIILSSVITYVLYRVTIFMGNIPMKGYETKYITKHRKE